MNALTDFEFMNSLYSELKNLYIYLKNLYN